MALLQSSVTVGASPVLLIRSILGGSQVRIINGGGSDLYIGGSNVTTTNGKRLKAYEEAVYDLPTSTRFYGVIASGRQSVTIQEITTAEEV